MKKYFFSFILFIEMFLFTPVVFAHGGVEKRIGDTLVTLFQTPLSPYVGETVQFSFILSNDKTNNRLINKHVRLVVTRTAFGDASKDKIILTKEIVSDVNGTITFSDTFYTTDYYDIDLEFGKPGDEEHATGFLVQPRSMVTPLARWIAFALLMSVIANGLLSFVYVKKHKH